jgi:Bacterial Ig domain
MPLAACAALGMLYYPTARAASVTFQQMDMTTLGLWKGVYGQDGNVIAQSSVVNPPYSDFGTGGGINLTLLDGWATDPRALLKQQPSYSPTERVESYFHTLSSMDFLVNAKDGQPHRIALYFCDYDRQGRSVTVQAIDSGNGTVFDTRSLANYQNGIYLVYTYSGNVTFRVANNNSGTPTGAVSGFFWGGPTGAAPPGDTTPPTVSIATPAAGTVSGSVTLTANANDNVGVVSVQYQVDNANLGSPLTAAPYSMTWNTTALSNGNHTVTAIARDAAGNSGTSAAITVNVSNTTTSPPPPPSGNSVTYLTTDTTTLGNWKGVYGQDGNVIAQSSVVNPPYSNFGTAGNINLALLDDNATDARAPLKQQPRYSPTERVESYFHTLSSMDFLVNTSDGRAHRIALYLCDYERSGRSVTVQGLDSGTGAVLDTRSLTNYQGGVYLVYNYSGNVTFRIINNNGGTPTGAMSGFFWGGGTQTTPPSDTTPPTVSISAPVGGTAVQGVVTVTAPASDNVGVAGVELHVDANTSSEIDLGPEITAPPYTAQWDTRLLPNGGHTVSATARDAAGNTATASIVVTVNNPPDTTPPTISFTNPVDNGTVSGNISVTVNANDNVGVASVRYAVDSNDVGLEITPFTLPFDTTRLSNGPHVLTATATDAAHNSASATIHFMVNNSVLRGNSIAFLGMDTKTLGNWKGVYGQDGNFIAESSYTNPPYSGFNAINTNRLLYDIWSTDPRAPLKQQYAYSPDERVVSHWYNRVSMDFQVNTSDNQSHRIAIYLCDWYPDPPFAAFSQKRSLTFQVMDTDTGAVLDTHVLTDYAGGIYLVYNYVGNITFHVTNNYEPLSTNPNATVTGFFWGGQGLPPQ